MCFPVNFAKFLRTPILTEHLRWLLLHISICQKGNLKSTGGNNSGVGNNSTNLQPTLPATNQHQTQAIPNSYQRTNQTAINPANAVTNFLGNSYKNILLQTANAEVINLDNRNNEKCNIEIIER